MFGRDARFISDEVQIFLRQNNATAITSISLILPVVGNTTPRTISFTMDWAQMGDMRIAEGQLTVAPLDGRVLTESLDNIADVLFENGAVRFTRRDATFRTSLTDGTDIETPATLAENTDVLPYEAGFRPRNQNNLGAEFMPLNPAVDTSLENRPVNPANGN